MAKTWISLDIYLITYKGKLAPYTVHGPIRGFNKNGRMVWRSYKTAAEAFENLLPFINSTTHNR